MASTSVRQPPVITPAPFGNNVIVNPTQRANPVLEFIRDVGREFGDILADYQVGRTTGVLYLSLKYHRLHPEYIPNRIEKLGHSYSLRILLVLCDITEHRESIRELTKTCLINNITIIVAFSTEEAGNYISIFKRFEHRPPDMIKERVDKDHDSVFRTALTSISRINKTDVVTLRTSFGSFSNIAKATPDQLKTLPGFGAVKLKMMKNAFEKPTNARGTQTSKDKGKGKAVAIASREESPEWESDHSLEALPESSEAVASTGRKGKAVVRDESPEWDSDSSLEALVQKAELGPPPHPSIPPPPLNKITQVWDIELDLNASDDE